MASHLHSAVIQDKIRNILSSADFSIEDSDEVRGDSNFVIDFK